MKGLRRGVLSDASAAAVSPPSSQNILGNKLLTAVGGVQSADLNSIRGEMNLLSKPVEQKGSAILISLEASKHTPMHAQRFSVLSVAAC